MLQCIKATEEKLRRRGICRLAIFGSMARGDNHPDSDVDIAVDIELGWSFSLIRM